MSIRFLSLIVIFLVGNAFSQAQTPIGCGTILNSKGYILISAHILGAKPEVISIEDGEGNPFHAELIGRDDKLNLAVIRANFKPKVNVQFRVKGKEKIPLPPVSEELANIIGFLEEEFEPRGAQVKETNDQNNRLGCFRVGIEGAYDCSGASVLDDLGLFIGMIAKGSRENSLLFYKDPSSPPTYGIDTSLIVPFLQKANIQNGIGLRTWHWYERVESV